MGSILKLSAAHFMTAILFFSISFRSSPPFIVTSCTTLFMGVTFFRKVGNFLFVSGGFLLSSSDTLSNFFFSAASRSSLSFSAASRSSSFFRISLSDSSISSFFFLIATLTSSSISSIGVNLTSPGTNSKPGISLKAGGDPSGSESPRYSISILISTSSSPAAPPVFITIASTFGSVFISSSSSDSSTFPFPTASTPAGRVSVPAGIPSSSAIFPVVSPTCP